MACIVSISIATASKSVSVSDSADTGLIGTGLTNCGVRRREGDSRYTYTHMHTPNNRLRHVQVRTGTITRHLSMDMPMSKYRGTSNSGHISNVSFNSLSSTLALLTNMRECFGNMKPARLHSQAVVPGCVRRKGEREGEGGEGGGGRVGGRESSGEGWREGASEYR